MATSRAERSPLTGMSTKERGVERASTNGRLDWAASRMLAVSESGAAVGWGDADEAAGPRGASAGWGPVGPWPQPATASDAASGQPHRGVRLGGLVELSLRLYGTMSGKLDAELAEAAGLNQEPPPTAEDGAPIQRPSEAPSEQPPVAKAARRHLGLLLTLLVVLTATVTLFLFGFKEAAVYAITVDQLLERRGELTDRRVRIDGELVPGSLQKRDEPCEYRFVLTSAGKRLTVSYPQCVVPDSFRDRPEGGVMVTAEGKLGKDGSFVAAVITPRCSSKYDPETRTMKPDGDSLEGG